MQRMKTPRKTHKKTRTGCKTCKRRKIKCDEERPACKNCLRHNVNCDFSSPRLPPDSHIQRDISRSHDDTTRYEDSNPQSTSDSPAPRPSMADLELLHNFCCATCYTLSSAAVVKDLWRINVPQLGFTHDFVMHGILAVSALHLAHSDADKRERYFEQATIHHQAALNAATPLLNSVSADNSSAFWIFSVLTLIFAVASPRKPGDFLLIGNTGVVPDWLYLLRGTRSIMSLFHQTLHGSTLGPLFEHGKRGSEGRRSTTRQEQHLEVLRNLINASVHKEAAGIYAETIDNLERSFAIASGVLEGSYEFNPTTFEITDVFRWPYSISDEYLSYLQRLAPEALAILAYFCVLLKILDGHWWMQGWGTHLMALIYSYLDEEHRLWIRWPIEEIGWIPKRP